MGAWLSQSSKRIKGAWTNREEDSDLDGLENGAFVIVHAIERDARIERSCDVDGEEHVIQEH